MKASFLPAKRKHRFEMKAVNEAMLPENYPLVFWEEFLADHRSYVVVVGGQVVGYCLCTAKGHIMSFAVLTAHQRRGYARELLTRVITIDPTASYTLHVRVSNTAACGLYRSCGFEVVQQLKSYYADGEDGYYMGRAGSASGVTPTTGERC